jgi:hypothetical protein
MAGKYRKIDPRIWNDEKFRELWDSRWDSPSPRSAHSHVWPFDPSRWKEAHCVVERNKLGKKRHRDKAWKFIEQRFGGRRCVWCGRKATCIDHVLPVPWGGTSDVCNLQPLCVKCNSKKGDQLPEVPSNA